MKSWDQKVALLAGVLHPRCCSLIRRCRWGSGHPEPALSRRGEDGSGVRVHSPGGRTEAGLVNGGAVPLGAW